MAPGRIRTWVSDSERWLKHLENEGDRRKFRYAVAQFGSDDPWAVEDPLEELLDEAVDWLARHSASSANAKRLAIIKQLQEADRRQRAAGAVKRWYAEADSETVKVSGDTNGYLFECLLRELGYHDVECVEVFRAGSLLPPLFAILILLVYLSRRCNDDWSPATHRQRHACSC